MNRALIYFTAQHAFSVCAELPGEQEVATQNFRRIISNGQMFEKEDCKRLKPTNAVNHSQ